MTGMHATSLPALASRLGLEFGVRREKEVHVTATLATADLALPLRPLAETAVQFRQECSALDQLVEELYRDVERLREELCRKADEIEDGRRKLAERGRQLAEQRKEGGQLLSLLQQQETRSTESLTEIKSLREQLACEREEAQKREETRTATLEQKLRSVESERDELRHELNVLQATAAANGGNGGGESLAPLMAELGDLRRQLGETQGQVADARTQLGGAIERATAAIAQAPAPANGDGQPAVAESLARLAEAGRERAELESELELVRTRSTELQEIVNQQRRELAEQRADVTTELRLLRELLEQRQDLGGSIHDSNSEPMLVGAAGRADEPAGSAPDPVVSSVMAQFARLQKDVAQRRKKK
jgi:chromosome segregation ATPase